MSSGGSSWTSCGSRSRRSAGARGSRGVAESPPLTEAQRAYLAAFDRSLSVSKRLVEVGDVEELREDAFRAVLDEAGLDRAGLARESEHPQKFEREFAPD